MIDLEQVLVRLAKALERASIPYMVIGGWAAATWGEQRTTRDIDITIWVEDEEIPYLLERLLRDFRPNVANPLVFIDAYRVLPMLSAEGAPIDLIFGLLPYEKEAIDRAVLVKFKRKAIRLCTPEDVILHKIHSSRERDIADVRAIVRCRFRELDLTYLEPRIEALAEGLTKPEILDLWRNMKRKTRRAGRRAKGNPS